MANQTTVAERHDVAMEIDPSDRTSDLLPAALTPPYQPRQTVLPPAAQGQPQAHAHTVSIMEHSPTIGALVAALAEAQGKFAPIERKLKANIQSRREGGASYKYDYAPLDEVLNAIRPALSASGIAIMQFPLTRANSVVVRTMLAHSSGEWIYNELSANVESLAPQDVGKVITYLRRYGLQAITGTAPDYDSDAASQERTGATADARPQAAERKSARQDSQPQPQGQAPKPAPAAAPAPKPAPAPASPPAQAPAPAQAEAVAAPNVGPVADVQERDGGAMVTLGNGFKASTRDAEVIAQLKAYSKVGNARVELVCRPPSSPRYAPVIIEVLLKK